MSKRKDDAPSDLADFIVGLVAVSGILIAAACMVWLAVGSS